MYIAIALGWIFCLGVFIGKRLRGPKPPPPHNREIIERIVAYLSEVKN